jgi:hypothetical protein
MQLYYKTHEGHERNYLYRAEYYNPMFCLGDHVYFEILCTVLTVALMEGLNRASIYVLLLMNIFDLLWKV